MTIDPKLMKAILAMDSYNRGYNAGIVFGSDPNNSEAIPNTTKIGNYTVIANSTLAFDDADQSIGFYAIAYQNNSTGAVTISYRGTDDGLDLPYCLSLKAMSSGEKHSGFSISTP